MSVSFRIHYDSTGGVDYFRNSDAAKTTLAETVGPDDRTIEVDDVTVLFSADATEAALLIARFSSQPLVPGVAWIRNERVEFFTVDTASNTIAQCRRGTKGTSAISHPSGAVVFDGGIRQRFGASAEYLVEGDGVEDTFVFTDVFAESASGSQVFVDDEIQTLGTDYTFLSFDPVEIEFTIAPPNGEIVRLSIPNVQPGSIEVFPWNDDPDGLTNSTTPVARFLRNGPGKYLP